MTKVRANTIEELADQMLIDPVGLRKTIDDFNAAVTDTNVQSVRLGRQIGSSTWTAAEDELGGRNRRTTL